MMTDWLGKRLTGIHRMGHLIYLIIKILLCGSQCLMGIHTEHKHLHVFAHSERFICTSSPSYLITNFLFMFFSKSLAIQSNHW